MYVIQMRKSLLLFTYKNYNNAMLCEFNELNTGLFIPHKSGFKNKYNTVGIWNLTIQNPDFLKIGFQMVWFSKGWAIALAIAMVPTIWKPGHSKYIHFCLGFKWLLTKWRSFVQNSNGRASGFQIPFEIGTICKPTSFWPIEIKISLDFRSLLYSNAHYSDPVWMQNFLIKSEI